MPSQKFPARSDIWWSNGIFFIATHVAAAIGVCYYPINMVPRATLVLCFILFQLGELAITIGYHRLYSHRAFRATYATRILLALVGASAMQGSIRWWCLRHRLHHRFTDDPIHDPYAATRGVFWSHMGWIFFKPHYERLELIDKADLESDPVVCFQHKYYVPIALLFGLVLPPSVGSLWGDAGGAFVWAGLVARILIWHCTFLVNSLAHWNGLQPYTDENTSRSNLILAVLTSGEGNHNFHHAFPHDYRSGPSLLDWDPTKWVILVMHALGLVSGLKRVHRDDIGAAMTHMLHKGAIESELERTRETWTWTDVEKYIRAGRHLGRCVLIIDGFVLDVTGYLGEHPGGASILRRYSIHINSQQDEDCELESSPEEEKQQTAEWAFHGGLNIHSRAAKKRMEELRVAKLSGTNGDDMVLSRTHAYPDRSAQSL